MIEPKKGNLSKVLQVLKQKVSRAKRGRARNSYKQPSLAFPSDATDAPAFWQRRFYDFKVWSGRKLKEKLDCMHRNLMRRKLVSHPRDWPWSSWSCYENGEDGLIRMDALVEEQSPGPNRNCGKSQTRTRDLCCRVVFAGDLRFYTFLQHFTTDRISSRIAQAEPCLQLFAIPPA